MTGPFRTGDREPDEDQQSWGRFVASCREAIRRLESEGTPDVQVLRVLLDAAVSLHDGERGAGQGADIRDAFPARADATGTVRSDPGATSDGGRSRPLDFRVRAVLDSVVTRPLTCRLRLADIAKALRVSPSYLSRLIAGETGASFTRHVQAARMKESARLLEETPMSVKEISSAAGYEHVPSFDRQFRRFYHLTPTEFRRRGPGSSPAAMRTS